MAEPSIQSLTEQLAQRDSMIAMMKTKTKEYVTKLNADREESESKVWLTLVCFCLFENPKTNDVKYS